MTELERYENCEKERKLITDFLYFCLHNKGCYLGNHKESLNVTEALNEYFGIDSKKLRLEELEKARKEVEKTYENKKTQ